VAGGDEICADFATTEAVLWIGDVMTDPGTIYCAASI
jgi:putative methionine-R-sulfoxide reductase with GAF domain